MASGNTAASQTAHCNSNQQQGAQTPGDYWAESPMTRRYSMRFDEQEEQQPTLNALSEAYNGYFPEAKD